MILSLLILIFIGDYLASRILTSKDKKLIFFSFFFFLGVIIGLRGVKMGVDTIVYYEAYNNTIGLSLLDSVKVSYMEIGYVLCTKVFQYLGLSYFQFQLCYSVAMMLLFGNFIFKNTKYPYFATLIFLGAGFFAFTYNIVRQMMAIAICANSWPFIKEKKYLLAIFIIAIGCTFHTIAVLFTIVLILFILKKYKIVVYGSTIFLFGLPVILPSVLSLIEEINPYAGYADFDNPGLKGGMVYMLWMVEILMIIYELQKKTFSSVDKVVANLALICIIMSILDEKIRYLDRIGLIFSPFVILMFCSIGKSIYSYKLKTLYFIGFSLFFLLLFSYRSSELSHWKLWI